MRPKLIPFGNEVFLDYNDNLNAVCKEHMIKTDFRYYRADIDASFFRCIDLDNPHEIVLSGNVDHIRESISRRINSKKYQEAEYFDIDGYLVPASKEKQVRAKNGGYGVTAQVKHSERKGDQIVIYAGKKGLKGKSQIFIDPTYGKLTFDQSDINPKDIFVKLEATFRDGSKATIEDSDGANK